MPGRLPIWRVNPAPAPASAGEVANHQAFPRGPRASSLPSAGRPDSYGNGAEVCHARRPMRDPEIIETELMEISAIAEDTVKFERIVAWCATHPDEVPFALHQLLGRRDKHSTSS